MRSKCYAILTKARKYGLKPPWPLIFCKMWLGSCIFMHKQMHRNAQECHGILQWSHPFQKCLLQILNTFPNMMFMMSCCWNINTIPKAWHDDWIVLILRILYKECIKHIKAFSVAMPMKKFLQLHSYLQFTSDNSTGEIAKIEVNLNKPLKILLLTQQGRDCC
jgi:hypothetical protein